MLTRLGDAALGRGLGEDPRRVQVVDPRSEKAGFQSEAHHLLLAQLQLVLALTHPGKRTVDLHRLQAKHKKQNTSNNEKMDQHTPSSLIKMFTLHL